jgi:hypothetical protein
VLQNRLKKRMKKEEDVVKAVVEDDEDEEGKSDLSDPLRLVFIKNNNFMCISTPDLVFLDIVNFLALGFSYSMYFKAYKIEETNDVFCYEYMTSLDKLNETSLPPYKVSIVS